MSAFLDKLAGYKTYFAIAAEVFYEVALTRHWVALDADTAMQIRIALLGAAGIAFRAGVQKAQDAAAPASTEPSKN